MSGGQKLTVGRQVHYFGPLVTDQRGYTGPFAATIVKVNDDGSVNLCVLYASAPPASTPTTRGLVVVDAGRTSEICERVHEATGVAFVATSDPCWIWPPRA